MRRVSGSLTVEAAVVIPVILGVCLFFVFLMRMVLVDALVGHALHTSARTLAQGHYLLTATGIREAGDDVRDAASPAAGAFEEKAGRLSAGVAALSEESGGEDAQTVITEAVSHPVQTLREISAALLLAGADEVLSAAAEQLLRSQMRQHLGVTDRMLRGLGVQGGLTGLDYSGSRMLMEGDTLDFRVRWKMRTGIPLPLPGEWMMSRRVRITALGKGVQPDNADSGSIWDMEAKARGQKIQDALGRNLPDCFTTFCRFTDGEATAIHSIDLTLPSYKNNRGLQMVVRDYIARIKAFVSESDGVTTLGPENVQKRRLILVIPSEGVTEAQQQWLQSLKKEAESVGVEMEIHPWKENADVDDQK